MQKASDSFHVKLSTDP